MARRLPPSPSPQRELGSTAGQSWRRLWRRSSAWPRLENMGRARRRTHTHSEAIQPATGTPRGREPGGAPTSGPLFPPPSARRPRPGPPRPAQAPPWRPRAAGRAEGAGGAPGPPLTWPSRVRGAAPAMLGGPGAAGAISAWRRPQPCRASRRARAQRRPRGSGQRSPGPAPASRSRRFPPAAAPGGARSPGRAERGRAGPGPGACPFPLSLPRHAAAVPRPASCCAAPA